MIELFIISGLISWLCYYLLIRSIIWILEPFLYKGNEMVKTDNATIRKPDEKVSVQMEDEEKVTHINKQVFYKTKRQLIKRRF